MASQQTLRDQQRDLATRARRTTDDLISTSDPVKARDARDRIVADVDKVVEIVETLARVEA